MKVGWGWKILILYSGFVLLITALVIGSIRQHFDLVSDDYYGEEIAYQKVIEAGKNQANLSNPLIVYANDKKITIDFPEEFRNKTITGDIYFYSPVDATWDRTFKINTAKNSVSINKDTLRSTKYIIKINWQTGGKNYYQESEIALHS